MKIKRLVPSFVRSSVKRGLQERSLQMGQAGQDLWVIGEVFNEKRNGFFIDIGAHDGVELSNSYLLEKKYDWTGICVEANPDSFAELSRNRSAVCVHACLDSKPGVVQFVKRGMHGGILGTESEGGDVVDVQARTLQDVLAEYGAPQTIDYISVDVEGAEDRVFEGIEVESLSITCMTIERPSACLRKRIENAGFLLVRDIPGLDAFYIHRRHEDQYLQNVFSYYKKRHVPWRWK